MKVCAIAAVAWAGLGLAIRGEEPKVEPKAEAKMEAFGSAEGAGAAKLYTLKHGSTTVKLTDFGARVVAVEVPDRAGKPGNIVLGFDSVEKYAAHTAYFGCTTGRFANRIAKGQFTLDGKAYQLATNNSAHHLHGGVRGFDKRIWASRLVGDSSMEFNYTSPDGEEGYPGELTVRVVYTLTASELKIEYSAKAKSTTVLNLTNHAYWNLAGAGSGDVLNHELTLMADRYVEPNDSLIPTGNLATVEGTALDFTKPHRIGERMAKMKEGVPAPGGYDHCYVLRGQDGKLAPAAEVYDPKSGRTMEVSTTEPGMQLYTGNFLDGTAVNGGFQQHGAFCLEAQHFPDSPNQPNFPSTVLKPDQEYRQTTVHKFGVK